MRAWSIIRRMHPSPHSGIPPAAPAFCSPACSKNIWSMRTGTRSSSINHLRSGNVFGAESVCAGQVASHVYIHTVEKSKILMLDFAALLSEKTFSCSCRMQVTTNLMQEFARQVMFFNSKIRILSQKKLRDKLKIYLQTLEIAPDGTVCLPYSRRELSEYLYADRSALSRELCKMRDEGILNFSGSRLQILDPDFLAI